MRRCYSTKRFSSLAGLVLLAVVAGCNSDQAGEPEVKERSPADLKPFRLTIEFGDQREPVTGTILYTENLTALDLLVAVSAENRIKVDYDGKGETAFVTAIDGIVGGEDGKPYWIYSVNGQLANKGAGVLVLNEGDQVVWKMGKYPE